MYRQNDVLEIARDEMAPDERLFWAGRPDAKRLAFQTLPIVLFGIPWTCFTVFWVAVAAQGVWGSDTRAPGAFVLFPLFGIPFVLVGLGMLSAPFWAYRKGQQTVYAVSDRRVLIIGGGKTRSVQSYTNEDIGTIERKERGDGSGDLIFSRTVSPTRNGSSTTTPIGFFGIPDVRGVETILVDLFKTEHGQKSVSALR